MFSSTNAPDRIKKMALVGTLQKLINIMKECDETSRKQVIWSLSRTFCQYCGSLIDSQILNCNCRSECGETPSVSVENNQVKNGGISSCIIK